MSAQYVEGVGVVLTLTGKTEGITITVPDYMLISALENHLKEVMEWLA